MKRKFKFYMTDPDINAEYKMEQTIPDYNPELETELDYILGVFKNFLLSIGYAPTTVSRIQFLETKEWKYVLERYGEWSDEKEELYKYFIKTEGYADED